MIDWLELVNWRAYAAQTFTFTPGITFILGPNGRGKTSLLEAISYALTGEVATVKERGKLLREPKQMASVRLCFHLADTSYLIARTQTFKRAEAATLHRIPQGSQPGGTAPKNAVLLASGATRVTEAVANLMGVAADFFQRILYMPEGAVFRFLNQPPGQALDDQIRLMLGFTQMDTFIGALDSAVKELDQRSKALRGLVDEQRRLDAQREHYGMADRSGSAVIVRLEREHAQCAEAVRAQEQRVELQRRTQAECTQLAALGVRVMTVLQEEATVREHVQSAPLRSLYAMLEAREADLHAQVQLATIHLARLDGERTAYRRSLQILQADAAPHATHDAAPCPVCGKPMTQGERAHVVQELQQQSAHGETMLQRATNDRQTIQAKAAQAQAQREHLHALRTMLEQSHFEPTNADETLPECIERAQVPVPSTEDAVLVLREQLRACERTLADVDRVRSGYATITQRLQAHGFDASEDADHVLVTLEIRLLSLRAAKRAAQATLAAQRNDQLTVIYTQLSQIWDSFSNEHGWQMELDPEGMPQMTKGNGQRFDVTQFSGGEKTAMLLLLHILLAHHFTSGALLLIDEPLEHLDPINRRSLIHFLMQAYRRGLYGQVFVATFEEALVRKYMADEGVHVIHP